MNKILKDLTNFGFARRSQQVLSTAELKTLKKNIEEISSNQDLLKDPFIEICGYNKELDDIIEKILCNDKIKKILEELLGKDYILWGGGSARISTPNDKGLLLHQDAPGEVGLIFLVNDQPRSSTILLKGSHFFSRICSKLSWNSPKIFPLIKKILSPLSGQAGDHFIWYYKTWHGRLPNKTNDKYISLFFPFFPKGTDRVGMLKDCNETRIKKISSQYIKKIVNNFSLSKQKYPDPELECMKIEKFKLKNIFNFSFLSCFMKIFILEIIFFPIRLLRIIKLLKVKKND